MYTISKRDNIRNPKMITQKFYYSMFTLVYVVILGGNMLR